MNIFIFQIINLKKNNNNNFKKFIDDNNYIYNYVSNLKNLIYNVDNSTNPKDYILVTSYKSTIYNSGAGSNILLNNLNIG
jgi:hypothetical protein